MKTEDISRRSFLKRALAVSAATAIPRSGSHQEHMLVHHWLARMIRSESLLSVSVIEEVKLQKNYIIQGFVK